MNINDLSLYLETQNKFASFLFTQRIVSSFNNNTTRNFNTYTKNDLTQTSQQTHDTLSNVISLTEFATKMLMCSLGASNNKKKRHLQCTAGLNH